MGKKRVSAVLTLSYEEGLIRSISSNDMRYIRNMFKIGQLIKYLPQEALLMVDNNLVIFDRASIEIISNDLSEVRHYHEKEGYRWSRIQVDVKLKFIGPVQTLNGDSPEIIDFTDSGNGEVTDYLNLKFPTLGRHPKKGELDAYFGPDMNTYYSK